MLQARQHEPTEPAAAAKSGSRPQRRELPQLEEVAFVQSPGADRAVDGLEVGQIIDGRYRIVACLGEGGMGTVFEAEHLKLRKPIALKVVHPNFVGNDEVTRRFAREALAVARLEHPHIASAIDYGTLPTGAPFLVTQLARGNNLRSWLETRGPFSWQRAVEIGIQLSDALATAHAAGIIHRDLKPDNVLVDEEASGGLTSKVLDFGIARVTGLQSMLPPGPEGSGQPLTRVGTVVGTVGYMAPEQATGSDIDGRADIYAVGLLLWEAVVGTPLYPDGPPISILTQQLTETAPLLRSRAPNSGNIPAALEELVAKLLQARRELRPASCLELRDQLRALLASERDSTPAHSPQGSAPRLPGLRRPLHTPRWLRSPAVAIVVWSSAILLWATLAWRAIAWWSASP